MANRDYEYAEAIRAIELPREPISIKTGWGFGVILAVIAALFIIFGSFDYAAALEIEADEKVARPQRVAESFTFPIPWDAVVTQSLPSGREATTRYYVKTSAEGK